MFGLLRAPQIKMYKNAQRIKYKALYCDICACLSQNYGIFARNLLINDIISIGLLVSNTKTLQYSRRNCVKGGVLLKRKPLSDLENVLSALSVYTFKIKIMDTLQDEQERVQTKCYGFLLYCLRNVFNQAENILQTMSFPLEEINATLKTNAEIEEKKTTAFNQAAMPSAHCYGLLAKYLNQFNGTKEEASAYSLGSILGKAVYTIDALNDMKADLKHNRYNVFNELKKKDKLKNLFHEIVLKEVEPLYQELESLSNASEKNRYILFVLQNQLKKAYDKHISHI